MIGILSNVVRNRCFFTGRCPPSIAAVRSASASHSAVRCGVTLSGVRYNIRLLPEMSRVATRVMPVRMRSDDPPRSSAVVAVINIICIGLASCNPPLPITNNSTDPVSCRGGGTVTAAAPRGRIVLLCIRSSPPNRNLRLIIKNGPLVCIAPIRCTLHKRFRVPSTGAYNYLHAMWFSVMPTEPPVTEEIELDCEES